ncbi:MAG: MarR family transcriptional regulator [Oscillospiraceae bacterium]
MENSKRKITKIAREVSRFTSLVLKNSELGASEYETVHCIRHNPGINQDLLAKKLNLDKSAVARQAQSLEKKGYITRKIDPKDGRAKQLFATEKAQSVKNSRVNVENLFYDWLFSELSQEEKEEFFPLLDRLYMKSKNERRINFENLVKEFEADEKHSI